MATGWNLLPNLPLSFKMIMTKPCIDPNDPHSIIIASHCADSRKGIYRYHIKNNTMSPIYQYHNDFNPMVQGIFVDPKRHILHILSGAHSKFIHFNLLTNKLEIENQNDNHKENESATNGDSGDFDINGHISSTIYLSKPMNQIHFADINGNHLRYSIKHQRLQQSKNKCNLEGRQFIYIPSQSKLYNFGLTKILTCFIDKNRNTQNHYFWRELDDEKLRMPFKVSSIFELINFNVILGFDNILFLFYFPTTGCKQIYCLDLLNMKWIKTNYFVPKQIQSPFNIFVFKYGNDAHLIDFFNKYHFTIDLFKIIPNEVIKTHRKHYKRLVMDYIKNMERSKHLYPLPFALRTLILNMYPL